MFFAGLRSVEKGAGTPFLHNLGTGETRQFAEPVRAIDDRVQIGHLCVAEHEVTVWKDKIENERLLQSSSLIKLIINVTS